MTCTTSSFGGECPPTGYYSYPPVGASTNANVGNNVFSPTAGQTQTLTVTDVGHWNIVCNTNESGNTGITGYPSLGLWFPQTALNSYSSIVSAFTENGNYNAGSIVDTGYDLWITCPITPDIGGPTPPMPASGVTVTNKLPYTVIVVITGSLTRVVINGSTVGTGPGSYNLNNGDTIQLTYAGIPPVWSWMTTFDVMLQHDISPLRGPIGVQNVATFGGTPSVPVAITWGFGRFQREAIFQLVPPNCILSGTLDVLAMLTYLVTIGRIDPNCTFGLVGYGFEICSTNNASETFQVSNFTWNQVFAEQSPGLELYGFPISGPHPTSTINSVTVSLTEHQSNAAANPVWFELWDYSGTPTQIGNSMWFLPGSTSTSNVTSAQFTGVTYNMLNTLRVRIYGRSPSGSGYIQSVDSVSLTVNYKP